MTGRSLSRARVESAMARSKHEKIKMTLGCRGHEREGFRPQDDDGGCCDGADDRVAVADVEDGGGDAGVIVRFAICLSISWFT